MTIWIRFRTLVVAAVLLLGCSSAFARMIEQGDRMATQGRWDEAVSFYEQAVRLEPDDPAARAKLQQARRAQGEERLARGRALLAEGKLSEALQPLFEATQVDPSNRAARKEFEQAKAQALRQAEQEISAGTPRGALALARAVLALLPTDQTARGLEQRARVMIADQSVARGQQYEQQGHVAAALVAYAEALAYLDTHAAAQARFASARPRMRERALFHVVAAQFVGDPQADDLGSTVGPTDLGTGLPAHLLLRVEDSLPPSKGFRYAGMRMGGMFRHYRHARSTRRSDSSCRYVCGQQTVENPAHGRAQAEANAAQSALASSRAKLRAARRAVPSHRRARDVARGAAEQGRRAVAAAEVALERCQAVFDADCSALEAERDALAEESSRADDDLDRAEQELAEAEALLQRAEQRRQRAESKARAARYQADTTPPTMVVDKHCDHSYRVETVSLDGEVEVLLRAEGLYDTTAKLHETVHGRFHAQDDTFAAERGKCSELEGGDPLELPSESDVRRGVVAHAVAELQQRIVAAYDKERRVQLERSRIAEQDAKPEAAVDGALRFLLTAPGWGAEEAQAAARIARVLGVSVQAARKAGSDTSAQ